MCVSAVIRQRSVKQTVVWSNQLLRSVAKDVFTAPVVSPFLKCVGIVVLVAGLIRDSEVTGVSDLPAVVLKDLFFTSWASINIRNVHPKASEALTLSLHEIFQIPVREIFKCTHLVLVSVIFNSHFEVSNDFFPSLVFI